MKAPQDVAWVSAREACAPRRAFAQLLADVRLDVETRAAQIGQRNNFGVTITHETIFAVTRFFESGEARSARFTLDQDGVIEVRGAAGVHRARPLLAASGRCVFRLETEADVQLESWQFRHRVLEPVLFAPGE